MGDVPQKRQGLEIPLEAQQRRKERHGGIVRLGVRGSGKGMRCCPTNNDKTKLTSREGPSAVGPVLKAQGGPVLCPPRNWDSILLQKVHLTLG